MNVDIRQMLPKDADQKGYVHYKSWQETYTGLIDEQYIASQTLEKCQTIANRWPENTLVLEVNGHIVGFSCYGWDDSGAGEVIALYILKEYQGLGLGRKLMDATIDMLRGCSPVTLYVLTGNNHAIGFYEHYGFRFNGDAKELHIGTELRMIYHHP